MKPHPCAAQMFPLAGALNSRLMKLLKLTLVLLLSASTALAQGTLYFSNHVPSAGLDAPVFDTDGKTGLSGYWFMAQLYAGPSANSLAPVGSAANFAAGQPGYWTASYESLDRIIPDVTPGSLAYAQVKVWSYLLGPGYDQVAAAGGKHGQSDVFTVLTGGDTKGGTQPPSFPAYMTELKSFSLTGVDPGTPEPATTTLGLAAVLGAILWARLKRPGRPA